MIVRTCSRVGSSGALAALLLMQGACSGGDSVLAGGDAIDRTTQGLIVADLLSINGTYDAACTDRGTDELWSVELVELAPLDNPPLTVVLNDTGCTLTLTELVTVEGGALTADPAIGLTAVSQVAASAFDDPVEFYANARLDDVDFADDFTLTVLYSDDQNAVSGGTNTAGYTVVSSTAEGSSVPTPDYSVDVSTLVIMTDVGDVVQTATGTAGLTAGIGSGQAGDTYVVADAAGLLTYAQIDAAYLAGTPEAIAATIPADAFTLVGQDLTESEIRTLILANTDSGVSSYEAFEITFEDAP